MELDSTNVRAPDFGPSFPIYPELPQLVRVSGAAVATVNGKPVYPAFVQQYRGNLQLGDREPCYLYEPNAIALGAGVYDCRLIGNYLSLPLFATTCCGTGTTSSGSSKG